MTCRHLKRSCNGDLGSGASVTAGTAGGVRPRGVFGFTEILIHGDPSRSTVPVGCTGRGTLALPDDVFNSQRTSWRFRNVQGNRTVTGHLKQNGDSICEIYNRSGLIYSANSSIIRQFRKKTDRNSVYGRSLPVGRIRPTSDSASRLP